MAKVNLEAVKRASVFGVVALTSRTFILQIITFGSTFILTILLDPSRTFEDFGKIEFTPIKKTVEAAVKYFNEHGVYGGFTHLKMNEENKK